MHYTEFKTAKLYVQQLKDEKTVAKAATDLTKYIDRDFKSKEYFSLVPLFAQKYPKALFRDFVDIDKTFAIVLPATEKLELTEALNLYLDARDILEEVTYMKVKNTGFMTVENYDGTELKGFWILLK